MKLYFMKQSAVDYIKSNMKNLYINYYREIENQWIYELFDYDPFEFFMEVPDFKLASYSQKKGEMDLESCKIMFLNLINISESQASDERLWAGLCHSTFYKYVRMRWDYPSKKQTTPEKDAKTLLSRFFFVGGTRAGFYRNTLAKYWWVGHATYQKNAINKFELLDALGPDDLTTKITDLFYSNTFSSNPIITKGICLAWKMFSDRNIKLPVKEYFRPALQYMNALGGGILLDILTENEIKEIFSDYISQLYSGNLDNGSMFVTQNEEKLNIDSEDVMEDDFIDTIKIMKEKNERCEEKKSQKEITKPVFMKTIGLRDQVSDIEARTLNEMMGKPEKITYGCRVVLESKKKGENIQYIIPKSEGEGTWYVIQKKLLNKRIGESFFLSGDTYTIKDVSW